MCLEKVLITFWGFEWESVVQDGSTEMLKKILKECESISLAFSLVSEHGPRVLKRYQGLMGE